MLCRAPAWAPWGRSQKAVFVKRVSCLLTLYPGLPLQGKSFAHSMLYLTSLGTEGPTAQAKCTRENQWVPGRGSSSSQIEGTFTWVELRTYRKVLVRHSAFEDLVLILQKSCQKGDPAACHLDAVCCSHIRLTVPVIRIWEQDGQTQVDRKSYQPSI